MQPTLSSVSRPGALVKVSVEAGGVPLEVFHHAGSFYVAGTPGSPYVLRVANMTDGRLEVVTSIDGRNTQKDEAAGFMNNGMLLRSRQTYTFKGWRVDDDTTREFLFGADHEDSVAAQATGSAENRGVIGIAAYQEHVPFPPRWYETSFATRGGTCDMNVTTSYSHQSPRPGGAAGMSATGVSIDYDLSTGIGEAQADPVTRVTFKRTGTPDVLVIRYASRNALVRKGVIRDEPDPFPGNGYGRMRSPRAHA